MADDDAAPWTIKAVPVATREKAVRYARMDGVTMAVWLARAVETEATRQDGNQVIPPGKPEQPAPVPTDLGGVLHAMAAALQAMTDAHRAELPVPRYAVRDTVLSIDAAVRVVRGLSPRQTGRRIGQTGRYTEIESDR